MIVNVGFGYVYDTVSLQLDFYTDVGMRIPVGTLNFLNFISFKRQVDCVYFIGCGHDV